jgi:flagellar L-ring protein precursor FlgH
MRTFACVLAGCLLSSAAACHGGSIWAKAERTAKPIHADDTAAKVGDTLTIVIKEKSVIENETTRNQSKKTTAEGTTGGTFDPTTIGGGEGKNIFKFPKLSMDAEAKNGFGGSATYDSDRSVADQITVTVLDVLPNGNLVILGRRERTVSGDTQSIQISGIVRPSDITFANTVRSDQVADFRVKYSESGQEVESTKPGWLSRILSALNPF